MIRSKLVRRGVLLTVGATLFAVPATAAQAAPHASCTGLILNEATSNDTINYMYKGDSFRNQLFPGTTGNGSVDKPIERFVLSRRAKVDYYDLRTFRFLASHTNVEPGIYFKDACHLGFVYVYP